MLYITYTHLLRLYTPHRRSQDTCAWSYNLLKMSYIETAVKAFSWCRITVLMLRELCYTTHIAHHNSIYTMHTLTGNCGGIMWPNCPLGGGGIPMGGGGGNCLIPPTWDNGGAPGDPIKLGGRRPPGLRPGCCKQTSGIIPHKNQINTQRTCHYVPTLTYWLV